MLHTGDTQFGGVGQVVVTQGNITLEAEASLTATATNEPIIYEFSGERAYKDVLNQVDFGPRHPGSTGHDDVREYIKNEILSAGWLFDEQRGLINGQEVINLIAKREVGNQASRPWVIISAHYDTRLFADQDPNQLNHNQPVPGANDGASGVAVLLELARSLPMDLGNRIWLVFFDAEDNGYIPGWDWILGSKAFANSLEDYPDVVVNLDMIGDADLNIYFEKNSDTSIMKDIWNVAANLGYSKHFIPEFKYRILDDHLPFIDLGIPAVDIIDFDYPYWHTIADTADKVSPESLQVVGETMWNWLQSPFEISKD